MHGVLLIWAAGLPGEPAPRRNLGSAQLQKKAEWVHPFISLSLGRSAAYCLEPEHGWPKRRHHRRMELDKSDIFLESATGNSEAKRLRKETRPRDTGFPT
jgi:hypothetical protein